MNEANDRSPPATRVHREAAQWVYRGLWSWLVRWMRVPEDPPTLPARPGQLNRSFQPSPEYLAYLKFNFWAFVVFGGLILMGVWILTIFIAPMWGIALTVPLWALLVVPGVISYVAMHLRYDTMWYVITDRSMRIRRGIWILHEVTITFENVQTVKVSQGPIQRWFGIGDVEVRTAGGGMVMDAHGNQHAGSGHHGVIEGITNAGEIRDLILNQLRLSKTAGLGDEVHPHSRTPAAEFSIGNAARGVGLQHLAVLREIRDRLKRV